MNIVKPLLTVMTIAFSVGPAWCAPAQTEVTNNTSTFPDSQIWQWVAIVAEEKTSEQDRASAYEKVLKFPLHERVAALQRIVEKAGEDYSVSASQRLLQIAPGTAGQVISSRIQSWSKAARSDVTASVADALKLQEIPELFNIARIVLRRPRPRSASNAIDTVEAEGLAAIILSSQPSETDRAAIERALLMRPDIPQLWLAGARFKPLSPELQIRAQGIYRNASHQPFLRLAAATSIADSDAQAREYVTASLNDILKTQGPQDINQILNRSLKQHKGLDFLVKLSDSQRLLTPLLYLEENVATGLLMRASKVKNAFIKNFAVIALAERTPERVFQLEPNTLAPPIHYALLAYAVLKRPALRQTAIRQISASRLDAAMEQLKSKGFLASFTQEGGILLGL